MRAVFRPEARAEALEARAWYESRVPGLGLEFARALEVAVQSALRTPMAFACVEGDCRRILLRRFPYSLVFLPALREILVVAVFHHRREPHSWNLRVSE